MTVSSHEVQRLTRAPTNLRLRKALVLQSGQIEIDSEATFQRLLQELDPAAEMQQAFRPTMTFRAIEKALALQAWLLWTRRLRDPNDRSTVIGQSSNTARAVAIAYVDEVLSRPDMARRLRDAGFRFDPATEVRQALTKDTSGNWNSSLTRAIIMITRGLAYRTLGDREAIRSPFLWSLANDFQTVHLEERAGSHLTALLTRLRPAHAIDYLGVSVPLREEAGGDASGWMPYLAWSCPGGVIRDASLRFDSCGRMTITPLGALPIAAICPFCGSLAIIARDPDHCRDDGADASFQIDGGELSIWVYRVYPRKGSRDSDLAETAGALARLVADKSHRGALVAAIGVGDGRHEIPNPYVREIQTDEELLSRSLLSRRVFADRLMHMYRDAADTNNDIQALAFVQRAVAVDPTNRELASWLSRF